MSDGIRTGGPLLPGHTPDPSHPSPQNNQAGSYPSTGPTPASPSHAPARPPGSSQAGSTAPAKGFEAELEDCLNEAMSHKRAAKELRQSLDVESQRLSNVEAAQSAQQFDETMIQSMQHIDARIDDLADDLQILRLRLSSVLEQF